MSAKETFVARIEPQRLERALPDGKPPYSDSEARAEADRCLYCHDAPCIQACPTSIDIPTFIKKIATGNTLGAAQTIMEQNILGYSCARVCPVEVLCVGKCVYNDWHRAPIQIGKLQRFATETALSLREKTGTDPVFTVHPRRDKGLRVALIGAGPASLACAAYLALEGHHATIYEKNTLPGGLNTTGVAPYKLHTEDSLREVDYVHSLGVEIVTGVSIGDGGEDPTKLLEKHDAVFIGIGLGGDTRLGVPGEDGAGVWGATALIEKIKNDPTFKIDGVRSAIIVGGGNTAIDVARELAQLKIVDVSMVYRRPAKSMSGYKHEMDAARREGVRLIDSAVPVEVVRANGAVTGLRVEFSGDGADAKGTSRVIEGSLIALAIGQSKLRSLASKFEGVQLDARGCVVVDATTRRTANAKVYAGGDCINGGKEVVNAVADGREAARAMIRAWAGTVTTSEEK